MKPLLFLIQTAMVIVTVLAVAAFWLIKSAVFAAVLAAVWGGS